MGGASAFFSLALFSRCRVLQGGVLFQLLFGGELAPDGQGLDGDAVLDHRPVGGAGDAGAAQTGGENEGREAFHLAFHGAILGSIIIAGIAAIKHTIKNMNQPVSATIKPVMELMKVRGIAARLENSAYWVAV